MKEIITVLARSSNDTCVDCWEFGAPPDSILTIPPPPMPAFLMLPFNDVGNNNNSNGPCPLLCDWTTGQGVELNELSHKDETEEDPWFLFSSAFFIGTMLLTLLVAMLIFKYRQTKRMKLSVRTKTFNHRTYESILYPPAPLENQDLWATITPGGKTHHVVVPPPLPPRVHQVKSFENGAFNSTEDYHPSKYGRPRVSFPKKIENPDMPPLNCYLSLRSRNYHPSLL